MTSELSRQTDSTLDTELQSRALAIACESSESLAQMYGTDCESSVDMVAKESEWEANLKSSGTLVCVSQSRPTRSSGELCCT
jgi:hypothetical protein